MLEYFDAYLIGLTATPNKQTFGFFHQNLVMEYPHEQAVADGVNVNYDVYRIKTQITEGGSQVGFPAPVAARRRVRERLAWGLAAAAAAMGGKGFETRQMLKTPQFYSIWLVFLSSAIAGLMVIYCIQLFGIDALAFHGVENAIVITGTAMAWYAIFNGLGRILWGMISDRIGRKTSIIAMSALQGLIMLATYHGFINFGLAFGLIVAASLIGFNYGGIFALFPAITADWFGNKEVGRNYGWVFTAYGVAGILGPLLAGVFKDAATGGNTPVGWMTPFLIAGVACLVGAIIMMFTEAPGTRRGRGRGRGRIGRMATGRT